MSRIIYILVFLAGIALLGALSCKKLARDNPLDQHNNSGTIGGVNLKFQQYTVVYDDNEDGIVNQNEMIYLIVSIKNSGSSTAKGVKAKINSSSSYISKLKPDSAVTYNSHYSTADIASGYSKYGYTSTTPDYSDYTVRFKIIQNTPAGTIITLNMDITDEAGNNWTDSFEVTVEETDTKLEYDHHTIVDDDNGDGIANQNETVYLLVNIKNSGTSMARDVHATISSTSSYVSGLEPTTSISYNSHYNTADISPGYSKYGYAGSTPSFHDYTLSFKIAKNTPAGTVIPLNMNITDEAGNTWTDSFDITVEKTGANLIYSEHIVAYDDNSDGDINPGEMVYLRVFLKNNGTSTAHGVKAKISTSNSYVSDLSPVSEVEYNSHYNTSTIAPSYSKYGYAGNAPDFDDYTVKFKVTLNTPAGTIITLSMNVTDEAENEWGDSFTVTVE